MRASKPAVVALLCAFLSNAGPQSVLASGQHASGGGAVTLTESVPFVAIGRDNSTPGAGADFFSLTVLYVNTPDLDQFDLFGSPATFAGTLTTGDVDVR